MADKKRRRTEIEKIEDKHSRQVTFTKRRQGLFKKASDLSTLTGAHLAVIVFSPAGNPFVSGHPHSDYVIARYVGLEVPNAAMPEKNDGGREESSSPFWWDGIDPEEVDSPDDLRRMMHALETAREQILARADQLAVISSVERQEVEQVSASDGDDQSRLLSMPPDGGEWYGFDTEECDDVEVPLMLPAGRDDEELEGVFDRLSPLNLGHYYNASVAQVCGSCEC